MPTWEPSFDGFTLQVLPPGGRCYYVQPEPRSDDQSVWRAMAGRGDSLGCFDELGDALNRCERHYRETL